MEAVWDVPIQPLASLALRLFGFITLVLVVVLGAAAVLGIWLENEAGRILIKEYRVGDRVRHKVTGIVYAVTKVDEQNLRLVLKNSRNEVNVFAHLMKDYYLILEDDQLTSENEAADLSCQSDNL